MNVVLGQIGAATGDVAVLAGTGSVTDADAEDERERGPSLMIEAGVGIGTGAGSHRDERGHARGPCLLRRHLQAVRRTR